jgi:hypothetical protein
MHCLHNIKARNISAISGDLQEHPIVKGKFTGII